MPGPHQVLTPWHLSRTPAGRPPPTSPTARDVLAYAGFLLVAATINLRSAVVQVNPLLYVLGYRVLSVTDDHGLHAYMVTRHRPPAGNRVLATRFRDDVLVDRT
jgi:hypothetical protein